MQKLESFDANDRDDDSDDDGLGRTAVTGVSSAQHGQSTMDSSMGLSGADIKVGLMAEKPTKKASAGFFVAETERDFVRSGHYQNPDDRPLHGSGSHYNLEDVQDIAVIDNYSE
jgi:hypothetical protein